MRRLLVGFFSVIGFLTVLLLVGGVLAVSGLKRSVTPLPTNIVLTADLTRDLPEGATEDPLRRLIMGSTPTLRDTLDAIEAAGNDARVKVLLARVGEDELGLAKIQEIRDAVAGFRAKGKPALAFADSFGEFGPGTRPYYLAAAFDEIWLQPLGTVGLTGLYADSPFLKGTLDILGITPQFDHREQYKTAMNILTESKMTAAHREEVEGLLGSIGGQIIRGIAQDRKVLEADLRAAVDRGPLLAEEAVQAKLVDRLGYRDEAVAHVRARAGSGAEMLSLAAYLDRAGRPHRVGPTVALIYGSGMILRDGAGGSPLTGSNIMSAARLTRAFRAAVRDASVRAILFRVDSPGGSAVASETIWREVAYAHERGKPVIVSMGDVAGSGGYYVAAAADKIVAEPATLTGSIGVLAGKLVVSDLLKKIGISTDSAQIGANAAMFSPTEDFSERGRARLEALLDETYRGFKDHVATGRHLSEEEVEAVAKGRVWSGEEAKARGLVDELGGYAIALRLAKQAANIPPDAPITVTVFPREKGLAEILYDRLTGKDRESEDGAISSGSIERSLKAIQPLLERLEAVVETRGALTMPTFGPVR